MREIRETIVTVRCLGEIAVGHGSNTDLRLRK